MSWPTPAVNKLIDAIVKAEGGEAAMVRAVRCSMPCKDYAEARRIALTTISHAAFDYAIKDGIEPFVRWFASRPGPDGKNTGWAPLGADNDPTDLNRNWPGNVLDALK